MERRHVSKLLQTFLQMSWQCQEVQPADAEPQLLIPTACGQELLPVLNHDYLYSYHHRLIQCQVRKNIQLITAELTQCCQNV